MKSAVFFCGIDCRGRCVRLRQREQSIGSDEACEFR